MTSTDITARAVLFGDHADAVRALTASIRSGGAAETVRDALEDLPQITKAAAMAQLGDAATRLLELDFTDILSAGWRKHEALRNAARRTLQDPGTEELVAMANHKVSLAHDPYLELLVDGRRVTSINFQLGLEFEIAALVMIIRSGHLIAVRAGTCKVHASLAIEGNPVVERNRDIDLPLVIRIGNGIPLLHGREGPTDETTPS
jgi:hypothetical protein